MKKLLPLAGLFLMILISPTPSHATIGVGIGTGKIQIDEELRSGMSYEIPSLTVLNTGDETSDYEVVLAYHQDQPELEPPEEWIEFEPQSFTLEPGKTQVVQIKIRLPIDTVPGDYFAYLEAHPTKKAQDGQTSIAIAAAAKLYFTIAPANIFQGIYYKIASFWVEYTPWTNIVAGILLLWSLGRVFVRNFDLQFSIKGKDEGQKKKRKTS